MKIVILGAGQVGRSAANSLSREEANEVTVVDLDEDILRNLQDTHFDGRRLGVDLVTPDFTRLGESFGVWSGQVRSAVELGPVLKEALHQDGPALIEVDMAAVGPMAVPFTGSAGLVPTRR